MTALDAEFLPVERPASPEKVAQLAEIYLQKKSEIITILSLIESGNYAVGINAADVQAVTNVFSLIRDLHSFTLSVIDQLLLVLDVEAGNDVRLSENTIDHLLAEPLASVTPNILHPDFALNQHDKSFFPNSLQQEPGLKQMALEIAVKHLRRPAELSEDVIPSSALTEMLMLISNHNALTDLNVSLANYSEVYFATGDNDLFRLGRITQLMESAFAEMTMLMNKVMRTVSRDLFNNIFSFQAGMLCMMGEEIKRATDEYEQVVIEQES